MGRRTKRRSKRALIKVEQNIVWSEDDEISLIGLWNQSPRATREDREESYKYLGSYFDRSVSEVKNKIAALTETCEPLTKSETPPVVPAPALVPPLSQTVTELNDGMAAYVDSVVDNPHGKTNVYIQTSLVSNDKYTYVEEEEIKNIKNTIVIKNYVSQSTQTDDKGNEVPSKQTIKNAPEAQQLKLNMDDVNLLLEYKQIQNMEPVYVSSLEELDNTLQFAITTEYVSMSVPLKNEGSTRLKVNTGGIPLCYDMSGASASAAVPCKSEERKLESPQLASQPDNAEEMDSDYSTSESEEDDMEHIEQAKDGNNGSLQNAALEPKMCVPSCIDVSAQNFTETEEYCSSLSAFDDSIYEEEAIENKSPAPSAQVQHIYQLPVADMETEEPKTHPAGTSNIQPNNAYNMDPKLNGIINSILSSLPRTHLSIRIIQICDMLENLRNRHISEVNLADLEGLLEQMEAHHPNFLDSFQASVFENTPIVVDFTHIDDNLIVFFTEVISLMKIMFYATVTKLLPEIMFKRFREKLMNNFQV